MRFTSLSNKRMASNGSELNRYVQNSDLDYIKTHLLHALPETRSCQDHGQSALVMKHVLLTSTKQNVTDYREDNSNNQSILYLLDND